MSEKPKKKWIKKAIGSEGSDKDVNNLKGMKHKHKSTPIKTKIQKMYHLKKRM